MSDDAAELVLVRHGETEWSLSGRHTGLTDIPLTADGERGAEAAGRALARWRFSHVFTSPLSRARETCRLAGLGEQAEVRDDLLEWDYGEYEGRTTAEIQVERPGWSLWAEGPLGGETVEQVRARADRVIAEAAALPAPVAIFAHGHILRVLTARWLGLEADAGRLFALDPSTISVLGHERETRVIRSWNMPLG